MNNNLGTVGDCVESPLQDECEQQEALDELDHLIQEGEDSGISDRTVAENLAEARQQAEALFDAKLARFE